MFGSVASMMGTPFRKYTSAPNTKGGDAATSIRMPPSDCGVDPTSAGCTGFVTSTTRRLPWKSAT